MVVIPAHCLLLNFPPPPGPRGAKQSAPAGVDSVWLAIPRQEKLSHGRPQIRNRRGGLAPAPFRCNQAVRCRNRHWAPNGDRRDKAQARRRHTTYIDTRKAHCREQFDWLFSSVRGRIRVLAVGPFRAPLSVIGSLDEQLARCGPACRVPGPNPRPGGLQPSDLDTDRNGCCRTSHASGHEAERHKSWREPWRPSSTGVRRQNF